MELGMEIKDVKAFKIVFRGEVYLRTGNIGYGHSWYKNNALRWEPYYGEEVEEVFQKKLEWYKEQQAQVLKDIINTDIALGFNEKGVGNVKQ